MMKLSKLLLQNCIVDSSAFNESSSDKNACGCDTATLPRLHCHLGNLEARVATEKKKRQKEELGGERQDGRSLWRRTFSRDALAKFWKSHSKVNWNFKKAEIVFCKCQFLQISSDLTQSNHNLQSYSNDYEKRIKSYCHMISS